MFFREALKAQIHLKEVQLQKEKEMIMARFDRNQFCPSVVNLLGSHRQTLNKSVWLYCLSLLINVLIVT